MLALHAAAVFVPRSVRERSGTVAGLVGLVVLSAWASPWAVVMCVGLAGAALAVRVRARRARAVALVVAGVIGVVGGAGLVVQDIAARVAREAAYTAAGDVSRGQLLPGQPRQVLTTLMTMIADGDDAIGCVLFDQHAQEAFAAAHRSVDCPAAIRTAHALIDSPESYPRIEHDTVSLRNVPAGTVEVDGCGIRWRPTLDELLNGAQPGRPDPGPVPGRLIVAPAYGTGWLIVNFAPC